MQYPENIKTLKSYMDLSFGVIIYCSIFDFLSVKSKKWENNVFPPACSKKYKFTFN
jgi:hypothetical protein